MRDDGSPKAEAGAGLAACLWQRVEGARELAVGSELVRHLVRAVKERHVVTSRRLRTPAPTTPQPWLRQGLRLGCGARLCGWLGGGLPALERC